MPERQKYLYGIAITSLGVLFIIPDALLIRLIDIPTTTFFFWRSVLFCATFLLLTWLSNGCKPLNVTPAFTRPGLTLAVIYALGGTGFILAIKWTTVANALILIAINPLIGAVLSWFWLQEKIALRTWIASLMALFGVVIIVSGEAGGGHLSGDLMALATAFCLSLQFVLIRKHAETDMSMTVIVAFMLILVACIPIMEQYYIPADDLVMFVVLCAVLQPVGFFLIIRGPLYIPAPEVGLLFMLETVLSPVLVWFVLSEVPSKQTFLGGAIILAGLLLNILLGARQSR